MPATDFGWALGEKPPIFQVYGTKRKCSNLLTDNTEMVKDNAKRRCLSMGDTEAVTMETQPAMVTDHCRCSSQELSTVHAHQPMYPTADEILSQQYPYVENNNNNNIPSLQPVFHTQSQHTQSHHTVSQHIKSHQQMMSRCTSQSPRESGDHVRHDGVGHDSDCPVTHMEAEDSACAQQPSPSPQGLAFCDNFCVGGDVSPRSHRVKCYCIPSWEGLIDSRQYMSDYY